MAAIVKPIEGNDFEGFLSYSDWFRPFIQVFDEIIGFRPKDLEDFAVCEEIICFFKAVEVLDTDLSLLGLFENTYRAQNLHYIQTRTAPLNQFIQLIRKEMNGKEIKIAIRNRLKNCNSNLASCRKLINGCFNTRGKLLVLRIDFGFKIPLDILNSVNQYNDLKKDFHTLDKLELLKQKISQLLNNRRHNKILNEIEGYILKFEHGIKKGFHVHAIFILDGNKHCKDSYFAQQITEYWRKITDDNGCTYNCHMAKRKYKKLGIGVIAHTDIEKRSTLDVCLEYLCKQDQYFIFQSLKRAKTIQISRPAKRRSNAGRPRQMSTQ
ncbi:hypothetical protein [Acinetobacter puyangensis]|uniref:hypothetical protein n=1 Tax=Acinetobacter puyangensis TaxID=1096779 RepID=UPI003A4DF96E